MGALETVTRIVQLGGAAERAGRVAEMRARFEARTGAFSPDDPWFEERSSAFWCDAVTGGAFGRTVEAELTAAERIWLGPLERAHRGLFRAEGSVLVDQWSGAELAIGVIDEASRAELDAATGQLFDARVIGSDDPFQIVLLPGAVFHPRDATAPIAPVLDAARTRRLPTGEVMDALLRMQRTLRSLSRVKAAYAYRPDALSPLATPLPHVPVRRTAKPPT